MEVATVMTLCPLCDWKSKLYVPGDEINGAWRAKGCAIEAYWAHFKLAHPSPRALVEITFKEDANVISE